MGTGCTGNLLFPSLLSDVTSKSKRSRTKIPTPKGVSAWLLSAMSPINLNGSFFLCCLVDASGRHRPRSKGLHPVFQSSHI